MKRFHKDCEVERRKSESAELEQKFQGLKNDLEEKKSRIESMLKAHSKLVDLGFDETALNELWKCTTKYGGRLQVLEAVNSFTGNAQIKEESTALDRERADFEAKRMKAEADHAHLQAVIQMCDTLLYKLRR